ncbi:MAG: MarR family transcriptional regulator [Firmicutes bacterium]|nr:MarR family transcriptional regulator [Bacillota bacterium]
MNCPYCSKEMARGYIHNSKQPVQWMPNGTKPSMFAFSPADNGIIISNKFSLFKMGGYIAEAYYCDACHIVIAKIES